MQPVRTMMKWVLGCCFFERMFWAFWINEWDGDMEKDVLQPMPAIWCRPLSKHRLPPARHQPSLLWYTISPNLISKHSLLLTIERNYAKSYCCCHDLPRAPCNFKLKTTGNKTEHPKGHLAQFPGRVVVFHWRKNAPTYTIPLTNK